MSSYSKYSTSCWSSAQLSYPLLKVLKSPIFFFNCLFYPSILSIVALCIYGLCFYVHLCLCNCRIFLMAWTFIMIFVITVIILSLSLVIFFVLKSDLPDVSIAIPSLLWLLFAWYISSCSFTFNLFVSLKIKSVSYRQHWLDHVFCFLSRLTNYLLLGLFKHSHLMLNWYSWIYISHFTFYFLFVSCHFLLFLIFCLLY